MNVKSRQSRAFTILELLVAMGLLVAMIAISGMVFKMAVDAHRRAQATGELTHKLRALVNQLNADFRGLYDQGEVTMAWVPIPLDVEGKFLDWTAPAADIHHYGRFDRVVFFANGNFQSYQQQPPRPNPIPAASVPVVVAGAGQKYVQGNMALICYMPANDSAPPPNTIPAEKQLPKRRILARSQHILASDRELIGDPDSITGQTYPLNTSNLLGTFTPAFIHSFEYMNLSIRQWLDIPADAANKGMLLSWMTGQSIWGATVPVDSGLSVDPRPVDPTRNKNIHMMLCEGVGEFSVQCWHNAQQRWFPEIVRNPDGSIARADFSVSGSRFNPGYVSWSPDDGVAFQSDSTSGGMGRALKFTFTLYDSRGVFKNGKTFTHIVYLK